jgi:Na+/melibiose symporter-like transporter
MDLNKLKVSLRNFFLTIFIISIMFFTKNHQKNWCKENLYSILIIISAILGLIFGFILKSIWQISPVVLTYIKLPGILIIRAFMMILVPLIVASLSTSKLCHYFCSYIYYICARLKVFNIIFS